MLKVINLFSFVDDNTGAGYLHCVPITVTGFGCTENIGGNGIIPSCVLIKSSAK